MRVRGHAHTARLSSDLPWVRPQRPGLQVGALATGPVGAVLGSAAVFGLEVGAGLKARARAVEMTEETEIAS